MKKNCLLIIVIAAGLAAGLPSLRGQGPEPKGKWVIEPMGYLGVSIDGGSYKRQVDEVHDFYLKVPNDDLLKGFRKRGTARARQRPGRVVHAGCVPRVRADRLGPLAAVRGHRRQRLPRKGRYAPGRVGQVHRRRRLLLLQRQAQRAALHLRQDRLRPGGRVPLLRQQGCADVPGQDHRLGDQEPRPRPPRT